MRAETTDEVTGGCLCGAVRYEVIGDPFVNGGAKLVQKAE